MNATLLQQHLRSVTGTRVSTQTVRNRLHDLGLCARRPMWDRGSRNNPAFVHENVRFWGGGVLAYGGISIDGRTDLYIIRDGPLTARRYRDEILRPIVVSYASAIGDYYILMDDNCRPHRVNLVEDFLFEEGIVRMEWPACSPDMNPIEQVWDALGRRVADRQPPPKTLQELERALLEESSTVHEVCVRGVSKSRLSASDKPRSERLVASVSEENIEKVGKLIAKCRQLTVRMIDDELQINRESM
ncbi:transposable element Tcb2 transposase [Trichonephila clavipes]|nr:transposable element Tcb2 transposase [Trichonephila clavipes]